VNLFERNPSYDLGNLLGGTEIEARNLLHMSENELSVALNAIPVFPLPYDTRLLLLDALDEAREDVAPFALLLGKDGSFVAGLGPRTKKSKFGSFLTHSMDFLLLSNFVNGGPHAIGMETWTPLCLPLYDDSGHFHAYCAGVSEGVFLLLLTTDPSLDRFHEASKRKIAFVERMKTQLEFVSEKLKLISSPEDFDAKSAFHVCVRMSSKDGSSQYYESKKSPSSSPLDLSKHREYLVKRYASVRGNGESKLIWDARLRDAVIYYQEVDLEIICLFPPLFPQTSAAFVVQKVKSFVNKNKNILFCFPASI
jgi:hypothetical protein